jgi:hypothetical protein
MGQYTDISDDPWRGQYRMRMEDAMTDADDLAARIATLEAELAALKAQMKPAEPLTVAKGAWPKYDPTEGFRLPASAALAMARVVPDPPKGGGFNAHAHAQTKVGVPGGFGEAPKSTGGKAVERGSGWVEPSKLESPPGLKWVDQQIDVADAIDRAELKRRLGGK